MEAGVCVNFIGGGGDGAEMNILGATAGTVGDDHQGPFDVPHGGRGHQGADPLGDDRGETTTIADTADGEGLTMVRSGDRSEEQRTPVVVVASAADPVDESTAGEKEGLGDGRTGTLGGIDRSAKLRSEGDDAGSVGSEGCHCTSLNESHDGVNEDDRRRLDCDPVDGRAFCRSDDACPSERVSLETDCLREKAPNKCSTDAWVRVKTVEGESEDESCDRRVTVVENDNADAKTLNPDHDAGVDIQSERTADAKISSSADMQLNDCNIEVRAELVNHETNSNFGSVTDVTTGIVETRNTDREVENDSDADRLLLPTASESADGVDSECLSPTVNLEFSAVYWTKEKTRPEKGEETVASTASTCKKRLHVKFAEEEHLVTGYLEPVIPWREAWLCSTSELVTAYKTACDRIGVKPLKKLLVQLEGVKRFDVRSDLLSLRGENLDWRHCETLEEVLKRVQFHTINMEEMKLDDDVAVTIFDLLHYYQSCEHLIMNKVTNLGTRGWQAWTRLMKQSTGLVYLEARGLTIPDHTLPVIGKYLRTGSTLQTLQLENSIRSGRHLNLLAAAMKTSQSVQELYLGANQLSQSDGLQLGAMLKGNDTLQLLDLRNNNLQDAGMGHICDGIAEQKAEGKGLKTFVAWNNQLTHQSMPALSRALAATKSLETLNIGYNNITNDGIHRLKDGLMQNKSLLRIGLQATKISCEGAVALAEFVAESAQLVQLDLRVNSIKTGGLMALSHSLKVNKTVTRVDLDKEPKKETDMKDFAEQQRRLLSDIESFVMRNNSKTTNSVDSPGVEGVGLGIQTSINMDITVSGEKEEVETSAENKDSDVGCTSVSSFPLGNPARCQTLESPSCLPESPSLIATSEKSDLSVTVTGSDLSLSSSFVTESVSASDSACTDYHPSDDLEASGSFDSVSSQNGISLSTESQKSVVSPLSATDVVRPLVPEKPPVPDKKTARTKRKFTISKAVLPSVLSAKPANTAAVLFTARPSSSSSGSSIDSDSHVCIVGSSLSESNSNSSTKENVSELDLHPLVKNFTTINADKLKSDEVPVDVIVSVKAASDVDQMSLSADAEVDETFGTVRVTETGGCPPDKPVFEDGRFDENKTVSVLSMDVTEPKEVLKPGLAVNGFCPLDVISDQQNLTDSSKGFFELSMNTVSVEAAVSLEPNNLLNDVDLAHFSIVDGRSTSSNTTVLNTIFPEQRVEASVESVPSDVTENEQSSLGEIGVEEPGTRSANSDRYRDVSSCSILDCNAVISGTDFDDSDVFSENSFCANVETVEVIQAGIRLQLWSAATDSEVANFLVSVSTVDKSEASRYQSLGNNGLHRFDLSSLGAADGKKGNSIGSEGTDTMTSDCEDLRSADDDRETESFDSEVAGWGIGDFAKESGKDGLFVGTFDESLDGDVICSINEISALSASNSAHVDRVSDDAAYDIEGVNASQP